MKYFYHEKPIRAAKKEDVVSTACPHCGNHTLEEDSFWGLAIRYCHGGLLQVIILSVFTCIYAWIRISVDEQFLQMLWLPFKFLGIPYSRLFLIASIILVSVSLGAGFVWIEIKLVHLLDEHEKVYGVKCKNCKNGFAYVLPAFKQNNPDAVSGTDSDAVDAEFCEDVENN